LRNVAIITVFDVGRDPRPKRIARCLSKNCNVLLIGPGNNCSNFCDHENASPIKLLSLPSRLKNVVRLVFRRYDSILQERYSEYDEVISKKEFDLIFCHDLEMLPIVLKNRKQAKVIFDAREYYPLHFENSFIWRLLNKRENQYLCERYLPEVNKMMTVSDGILEKYAKEFNVQGVLYESLPEYVNITPSKAGGNVRIIYHGAANSNRKLERMIQMIDLLDERFTLDLMLVSANTKYYDFLLREAEKRKRVNVIKPVPQDNIVEFCSKYDIGIFICPPTTFNLEYALPNKLFEYIQSRLMVAISPSPEMRKVVERFNLGVISSDFTPQSMAGELRNLSNEKIQTYKENANKAARLLNAESNCEKLKNIVSGLY